MRTRSGTKCVLAHTCFESIDYLEDLGCIFIEFLQASHVLSLSHTHTLSHTLSLRRRAPRLPRPSPAARPAPRAPSRPRLLARRSSPCPRLLVHRPPLPSLPRPVPIRPPLVPSRPWFLTRCSAHLVVPRQPHVPRRPDPPRSCPALAPRRFRTYHEAYYN